MDDIIADAAQTAAFARSRPKPLLFLHIPKTAGTSFLVMLQNLFGDGNVLRLAMEDANIPERLAILAGGGIDEYACLNGHLPAHLFSATLDRYEAFTLLRNPIHRVMSLFRFLRHHPVEHLGSISLRPGFSFDEFIDCRSPYVHQQVHNGMTRMLCDNPAATDHKTPLFWTLSDQPAVLESAMATLGRIEIGLVEQFEATHALLRERWGIPYALAPLRLNTTASGETETDALRLRRIVERNTLDIALYEAAAALFAQRNRVSTRPASALRLDAVFTPALDTPVPLRDMPGRQGFHPFESIGFAWIDGTGPARIYLRPPAPQARLELRMFAIATHYPVERIRLSLDSKPVHTQLIRHDDHWFSLSTDALPLGQALHELSIETPYAVPVRFLEPGSFDGRELGVAMASLTLRG